VILIGYLLGVLQFFLVLGGLLDRSILWFGMMFRLRGFLFNGRSETPYPIEMRRVTGDLWVRLNVLETCGIGCGALD